MQSSHFDAGAYQGAIYGSTSGFDAGTIKLHHTGYSGEPDASCYPNYVSHAVQPVQGYNCRDPPTYSETSFFHSAGIMPNFGNMAYYKMHNRQMEISDYSMMTRPQDNFLMKPPDPLTMTGSPGAYDSNNSGSTTTNNTDTSTNVHEDQPHHQHHHHHQHPHQHQHHQHQHPAYENQNIDNNKLLPDTSSTIFSHNPSVKLEPMKMEAPNSHGDFDDHLHTSNTQSSSSLTSRGIHPESDVTSHPAIHSVQSSVANNHNISRGISPQNPENKSNLPQSENPSDNSQQNPNDEKKEEETSADSKPTMSYIALIAKAILESEQRRLNLGSIYNWIEKHYPFYKNKGQGWRNSVRHNLSLNDCFIKAGRCEDGKGNYWAIHPANIQDFMRGDFRQRRRSRRRGRKKECDLSMYHVPNGYLQSSGTPLASSMTFNPAALSSIYSPYTEAERRAYRLDEALLRQSMNNPFVKWYQQGVSTPGYGVSTPPPACNTGVYPNSAPVQWPQSYSDTSSQSMYPALNSTFPR